jgi:hypothetical protein
MWINSILIAVLTSVIVRSLCALAAGGPLSIPYIDIAQSRSERRTQLFQQYHFWCRCVRCEAPLVDNEAALGAFLCLSEGCGGLVPAVIDMASSPDLKLTDSDATAAASSETSAQPDSSQAVSASLAASASSTSLSYDAKPAYSLCLKCKKAPSDTAAASWVALQSKCNDFLVQFDNWYSPESGTSVFCFSSIFQLNLHLF